jgi:hypothetical protein
MIGDEMRILGMDMVAILVAALRFILAPSQDKLVTCIRYLYLVLEGVGLLTDDVVGVGRSFHVDLVRLDPSS